MIAKLKKLLKKDEKPRTDFSDFFYNASSAEKKKLLTEVIREANKDQRALIERYNKTITKTT